ncbi:hypothetical protein Q7C_848 [Methylophaga frappieri]|uniref:VWFA domain-containing protein n=1 Tax=Methylophaga frappieri (strain ATCC BAA-2434 / DSM 25690 / JAM7) TaxID=754477 RepID=I1YGH4_METFJ|nr:phage tail protein [Methylophaga frappieri]AFJ02017.1 hypothetical protein Q7C_848 [Methylophaga frappieri]
MGGSGKRQTVGYKYYEDQHLVLALSNFDHISHIWFAENLAWVGIEEGLTDDWSTIEISQPKLFGGEQREGGVSGTIRLGMGWPTQPRLARMVSRIGGPLMPAYRGVVSLFFDDFYFGNSPYIKPIKFRAQAIHKLSDGSPQWYDEKAAIFGGYDRTPSAVQFSLDASGSMFPPDSNRWAVVKEAMNSVFDWLTEIGISHDIRVNIWASGSQALAKYNIDAAAISELRAFVNAVDASMGATDFTASIYAMSAFFNTSNKPIKKFIFLTDGEPSPEGTDIEASEQLSNIPNVQAHAFNIDLADTSHTELMDNTPADGVPVISGSNADAIADALRSAFTMWDINPIHLMRECHTDKVWGGRFPESKMGDSYETAADTLFEEKLGVSFLFTEEIRWREIIEEIARHIDAIPYQDPETGLMEIKLIRDDYDPETLPILDPSNSELVNFNAPMENEIFNQVVIEFWNRETGKDDSVTLSDAAAVDAVGYINQKTYQYAGITNRYSAMIVGERDLARSSKPFYQGRIRTNRVHANLRPGDVFKLNSPDDDIETMVCRVTKRNESSQLNGDITLEWAEDVFGQVFSTFGTPAGTQWSDSTSISGSIKHKTAFEIPYFLAMQLVGEQAIPSENTSAAYGFAAAEPSSGVSLGYDLYVYPEGTTQEPDPEEAIESAYTPTLIAASSISDRQETVIPISSEIGVESLSVGQLVLIGNALDAEREIAAVSVEFTSGDSVLYLLRGVADTLPLPIPAGAPLYVIGEELSYSETIFLPGETVEGYAVANSAGGTEPGPYAKHAVEMDGRIFKPYPPANFRVEGLLYPGELYQPPSASVTFTWSYRDRIIQADQVVSYFNSDDYGPEVGTTYLIEADALDVDGLLIEENWFSEDLGSVKTYDLDFVTYPTPTDTFFVVIRLWAVREDERSLQAPFVQFIAPDADPDEIDRDLLSQERPIATFTAVILGENGEYIEMERPE